MEQPRFELGSVGSRPTGMPSYLTAPHRLPPTTHLVTPISRTGYYMYCNSLTRLMGRGYCTSKFVLLIPTKRCLFAIFTRNLNIVALSNTLQQHEHSTYNNFLVTRFALYLHSTATPAGGVIWTRRVAHSCHALDPQKRELWISALALVLKSLLRYHTSRTI